MKEIPILFSGKMIRVILAGRKTMTRRIRFTGDVDDILWVRETWAMHPDGEGILYRATDPGWDDEDTGLKWKPSIFMPKWGCRIRLKIVSVKKEHLKRITALDAIKEGIIIEAGKTPVQSFKFLWDSLNAKRGYSWKSNPVVYVVTFRRI